MGYEYQNILGISSLREGDGCEVKYRKIWQKRGPLTWALNNNLEIHWSQKGKKVILGEGKHQQRHDGDKINNLLMKQEKGPGRLEYSWHGENNEN